MPTSISIWDQTGTQAHVQLKSLACQEVEEEEEGASDMMISQRRIVDAMTGMRPIERISARAAGEGVSTCLALSPFVSESGQYLLRCLRLNLSNLNNGNGKRSKMTSEATSMAPDITMKSAPLKQLPYVPSMSQARDMGRQNRSTYKEYGETECRHETGGYQDCARLYDPW
jgi:hypothetical protein